MPIAGTWYSNAPHTNTGYGTQTRQLVPRMVADGHKIAVQANYGSVAAMTEWNGIPVYPIGYDGFCNDMVGPVFTDWTRRFPDHHHVLFGLFDAWVMNAPILDEVPVVWWTPIDHAPAPPQVLERLRKPNWLPVAMSRFGERMINDAGIDCAYAPHAIDTSLYRHTPSVNLGGEEVSGRRLMGIPEDAFVIGSFDANKASGPMHRKAWGERLMAASIFMDRHPDAMLYLHTEIHGAMNGWRMEDLVKGTNIDPDRVRYVNQWAYRMGIPDEGMAALYSAADVVLMPSYGEGFGLCALEAQSVGARVILNDCTAQTELCGPDSYLVHGQPLWDAPNMSYFTVPNVHEIVDALEQSYRAPRERSKANRRFAQQYEADKIYRECWRPILLQAQS